MLIISISEMEQLNSSSFYLLDILVTICLLNALSAIMINYVKTPCSQKFSFNYVG